MPSQNIAKAIEFVHNRKPRLIHTAGASLFCCVVSVRAVEENHTAPQVERDVNRERKVNAADRVGCGGSPWQEIQSGRVSLPLL